MKAARAIDTRAIERTVVPDGDRSRSAAPLYRALTIGEPKTAFARSQDFKRRRNILRTSSGNLIVVGYEDRAFPGWEQFFPSPFDNDIARTFIEHEHERKVGGPDSRRLCAEQFN